MANIVNQTFFVRDLTIANLTNTAIGASLNSFIDKYEPDCLLQILGYPLYKLFKSESSQRMTDLLNGSEFTNERTGELAWWQGLKHDTDISLIANYVYFRKEEYDASHSSGTGTRVQKPEAGVEISPAQKMANAWNFFSSEVFCMTDFLWMKKTNGNRVYPEFSWHQFNETRRISRPIDSVFAF